MSFMLTPDAILEQRKTVTRRLGWAKLQSGTLLQPVRKVMGLRKGEQIERLGGPVIVASVRREPLSAMLGAVYGPGELAKECVDVATPAEFVEFFCRTHKGCTPTTVVTRIQFDYLRS